MGRPPIFKKAMTAAQRQKRRRRVLKRERKAVEIAAKRAENHARFIESARRATWMGYQPDDRSPPSPPLENRADELAQQLLDAIQLDPDLTVADVQAALERRSA